MVQINGKMEKASGVCLLDYLTQAGYNLVGIAVERNEEIVSKADYDKVFLEEGDVVEVVSFVGGGSR